MNVRKLGRGLDSLISPAPAASPEQKILQVDPNKILTNKDQPRKRFSLQELEDLKTSISKEGILQPVLIRETANGLELIAGERRLRAAKDLGLRSIPAIVIEAGNDRMLELALIENIHRENLNPIELAEAFRKLLQMKSWTQESLAQNLGLSRSTIANSIRLLELPEDIQSAIARGQITMGHAKVLLSVTEPKEQRLLFEKIAEEKLSVRDLEGVRAQGEGQGEGKQPPRKEISKRKALQKNPQIASLEEELSRSLGSKVTIRQGKGKGSVTIEFYSHEDFDRIRKILTVAASK